MSPTAQDQYDTIIYRLSVLEDTVRQLQQQFNLYVPARENEIRLKSIHETAERTEHEIRDLKSQLKDIDTKLDTQSKDIQTRDNEHRKSLDDLKIKMLWGAVSAVIAIISAWIITYGSHLIVK